VAVNGHEGSKLSCLKRGSIDSRDEIVLDGRLDGQVTELRVTDVGTLQDTCGALSKLLPLTSALIVPL
jgi:hypothetical protein